MSKSELSSQHEMSGPLRAVVMQLRDRSTGVISDPQVLINVKEAFQGQRSFSGGVVHRLEKPYKTLTQAIGASGQRLEGYYRGVDPSLDNEKWKAAGIPTPADPIGYRLAATESLMADYIEEIRDPKLLDEQQEGTLQRITWRLALAETYADANGIDVALTLNDALIVDQRARDRIRTDVLGVYLEKNQSSLDAKKALGIARRNATRLDLALALVYVASSDGTDMDTKAQLRGEIQTMYQDGLALLDRSDTLVGSALDKIDSFLSKGTIRRLGHYLNG